MHPRFSGQGWLPRFGGGYMQPFGHIYALQQELLDPNAQNWFRAAELWHTAREEGVALNVSHYSNILRQCVQPAAWRQTLVVLKQMQRDAIRPDVVCVSSVLAACTEAGQYDEVEVVFERFSRTMMLDSVCYLALIRSRAERGEAAAAIAAGRRQQQDGIPFLPHTFTHLLEACAATDDVPFAMQLVRRMRSEEWQPHARDRAAVRTLSGRHSDFARDLEPYEEFRPQLTASVAGDSPT